MEFRARFPAVVENVALFLFFAAFITIQTLIGGTRMVFSLPAYFLAALGAILLIANIRQAKPAPCRACIAVTAIAFAYLLARALLSPVPYITRSDICSLVGSLVVYFAFALFLTANTARMWFLAGLLVFALAHIFVGAIQFRDGNNFMPIAWLQRVDYGARASGFYICPNHLAGLLEVLGIFAVSIACWSRWRAWAKLLVGYIAACCYVGIVLTGSRGGYLSTGASFIAFGILSLLVLRKTTPRLFWRATGFGLLGAIVFCALVAFGIKRSHYLTERAGNVIDTSNVRRDLWQAALREWNLAPVFGTGSATYLYYGRLLRNPVVDRDPVYAHSDYLQLLAEYGIIGGIAISAVVLVHTRRGLRSFDRLGARRVAVSHQLFSNGLALNIAALSALAALSVHEALDFNLHIPANALLLAFVFAVLANDGVVRDREVLPVARVDLFWRLTLSALAIVLVAQSVRLFPSEYFSERARAAVRDNKPALAILNANRALKYDAKNPDVFDRLGQAWTELGDEMNDRTAADSFYTEAIDAFSKAREIVPQDELYALDLATTLDSAKRFPEAEWNFCQARQLDPQSQSLQRYYGNHLELWKQPTENAPPTQAARIW